MVRDTNIGLHAFACLKRPVPGARSPSAAGRFSIEKIDSMDEGEALAAVQHHAIELMNVPPV